jgi:type I restriction enzyme, S subunit
MNAERLLAHYERIADAPDAIARLRRFVLDLAVRGKLVEQDPRDEPASQLLKRITAEKASLVKAGEIRKPPLLEPVGKTAAPFPLPLSWVWVRVGDIFEYDAGTKRDPKELHPDRWLLELEDIEKDTSTILTRYPVNNRSSLSTKSEFRVGDILYGKLRPYLNKVVIADEPGYSTTEIVAIRPFLKLCPAYCSLAFRRPDFVAYVERLGRGTKMPRLRTPDAIVAPFPLPPLAEQHRIVAKVDELMALCDRLEEERARREAVRDRLTTASLTRLTAPDTDAKAFKSHARFARDALPALTTRPEQIKALRHTILNLAVRGMLVEQDPADEPASELQKRIARDIAEYIRANCVRSANAEKVAEEDQPFPLPRGWVWTRLAMLCRVVTDGDHQPPPRSETGVAFLTIGNVTTGKLDFAGCRRVTPAYFSSLPSYRTPAVGDLLYTVVGATFGRPVPVDSDEPFCVQRHIAIIKPSAEAFVPYLQRVLASPFVYDQAAAATTGSAQPTIALKPLRGFLIPLPPLAEQHRIVAKVDAVMALCDQLEASLVAADTTRRRLLEALLHVALVAVGDRELEAAE